VSSIPEESTCQKILQVRALFISTTLTAVAVVIIDLIFKRTEVSVFWPSGASTLVIPADVVALYVPATSF
jgi:hypothetical protein